MSKFNKAKGILVAGACLACAISFYAGRLSLQASQEGEQIEAVAQPERPSVKLTLSASEDGSWIGQIEGEATLKSGENIVPIDESGNISEITDPSITVYNDSFEFTSEIKTATITKESDSTASIPTENSGAYVASKNGSKYHPVDSGTAKRIKEENKVFFNSKAEAEAAGYEPGSSVK